METGYLMVFEQRKFRVFYWKKINKGWIIQSLPFGVEGSGPGSTDFYKRTNQGSEYFSLSSGYKNLSPSWQNQISSVSTASPTASYSTTLWERTSTEGYGKGVVFKHADWYGKTANLAAIPTSAVEVKSKIQK